MRGRTNETQSAVRSVDLNITHGAGALRDDLPWTDKLLRIEDGSEDHRSKAPLKTVLGSEVRSTIEGEPRVGRQEVEPEGHVCHSGLRTLSLRHAQDMHAIIVP